MRLNHNMASLSVYQAYQKVLSNQNAALQRISSGKKVSKAGDNPNALAESEKMNIQIRGMQMAQRNMQDGVSMLQTAEGGLDGMTSMLQRVRQLTVQAGSNTNTADDKNAIQSEINQLVKGIDDISNGTEFNGNKLLQISNGDTNTVLNMATGANAGESIAINRYNLTSTGDLKLVDPNTGISNVDVTTPAGVDNVLKTVDDALSTVVSVRSHYGALENRFESSITSSGEISDKLDDAASQLTDADISEEMVEYTKDNVLSQAGTAMMVQTNKFPQDVLRILDRR